MCKIVFIFISSLMIVSMVLVYNGVKNLVVMVWM